MKSASDRGHPGAEERFKLEKLLLALSQRWHPPSDAIASAFSRHAAALDRLFERARRTPELAFLDAQVYPEWPRLLDGVARQDEPPAGSRVETLWLPQRASERRHGFYFCNSLIQLMENVYHDLDLESQHDHPDNRGWINLFKHWSWSGMFRATWAISAATYGNRFQAFCERRLDLALGKVTFSRLRQAGAEEPLSEAEFRDRVRAIGPAFLNFLEREQIELFLRYARVDGGEGEGDEDGRKAEISDVVQFELVVGSAQENETILRFGFGYALLDAARQVVLFRVQDHLRAMGLGRQALSQVVPEVSTLCLDEKTFAERYSRTIESVVCRAGGSESERRGDKAAGERFGREFAGGAEPFVKLVRSVRREMQNGGGRRSRRTP